MRADLPRGASDKALIVTADDFGLHEAVNEAVERGSREGILTAASLMVGAPAAADAVRRARRLPALRVGLHVVLADGLSTADPSTIPGIVDAGGRLSGRMAWTGLRAFVLPAVRRQFEREVRAQFAAFAGYGLALDHVNVHKHFHLHPTLLDLLIRVGREYGMKAMRMPNEPLWCAARVPGSLSGLGALLIQPWVGLLKRRLLAAGIAHNDWVFGLTDSGSLDEAKLLNILARLPSGLTEIYLHPATATDGPLTASMQDYRHADELAAILSPRVRAALERWGIVRGGFTDLCVPAPGSRAGAFKTDS